MTPSRPRARTSPKRPSCPRCASGGAIPIAYGLPGDELAWAAERGEVVLGGCIVEPDAPTRACTACGYAWTPDEEKGPG